MKNDISAIGNALVDTVVKVPHELITELVFLIKSELLSLSTPFCNIFRAPKTALTALLVCSQTARGAPDPRRYMICLIRCCAIIMHTRVETCI